MKNHIENNRLSKKSTSDVCTQTEIAQYAEQCLKVTNEILNNTDEEKNENKLVQDFQDTAYENTLSKPEKAENSVLSDLNSESLDNLAKEDNQEFEKAPSPIEDEANQKSEHAYQTELNETIDKGDYQKEDLEVKSESSDEWLNSKPTKNNKMHNPTDLKENHDLNTVPVQTFTKNEGSLVKSPEKEKPNTYLDPTPYPKTKAHLFTRSSGEKKRKRYKGRKAYQKVKISQMAS